jgi:hypothetical protein
MPVPAATLFLRVVQHPVASPHRARGCLRSQSRPALLWNPHPRWRQAVPKHMHGSNIAFLQAASPPACGLLACFLGMLACFHYQAHIATAKGTCIAGQAGVCRLAPVAVGTWLQLRQGRRHGREAAGGPCHQRRLGCLTGCWSDEGKRKRAAAQSAASDAGVLLPVGRSSLARPRGDTTRSLCAQKVSLTGPSADNIGCGWICVGRVDGGCRGGLGSAVLQLRTSPSHSMRCRFTFGSVWSASTGLPET